MSDQSEMPTPDPMPEGEGEAVATADSPWAFSPEREERFQVVPNDLEAVRASVGSIGAS